MRRGERFLIGAFLAAAIFAPGSLAAAVSLCAEVEEPIVGESCFQAIVNQAHAVVEDLEPFCGRLPDRWRQRCLAR